MKIKFFDEKKKSGTYMDQLAIDTSGVILERK